MARDPIFMKIWAATSRRPLSLRRRRVAAGLGLVGVLGMGCLLAYVVLRFPFSRLEDPDNVQPVNAWLVQLGAAAIGLSVLGVLVTVATSTATWEQAATPERLLVRCLGLAALVATPWLAAILGLIASPASNEHRLDLVMYCALASVVSGVAAYVQSPRSSRRTPSDPHVASG